MLSENRGSLLFSGSSHPTLAKEVADYLGTHLSRVELERFPDGETSVVILDNVRGQDVFVFQSIALDPNYYLVELLIMVDALKRASAHSITAVIPYFGYCRQDRKDRPRVPITAKLVANLLVSAGVSRVVTMDLHTEQLQGFFDIPVEHLYGRPELITAIKKDCDIDNLIVIAPDVGSSKLAKSYAQQLDLDFAVIDKHRVNPRHVEQVTLIGNVTGKDILLADDMCTTASTLVSAAKVCQEKGANRVFAVVTHGIFVESAIHEIEQSPIEVLYVSNTICSQQNIAHSSKLRTVSVANLFGQAIRCIESRESISSIFAPRSK